MARSTFYYHLKRLRRPDKYKDIKEKVYSIFHKHKGRYGYRRITLELRKEYPSINHKTVRKLMNMLGLKCLIRKVRYKSYKGPVGKVAPNALARDFKADKPCVKVATDVTQIAIGDKKCYFSPIMDIFNGEIICYTISDRPDLKMVMDMLKQMYRKIHIPQGMILHSDQGWHYQHPAYQSSLQKHGITQSMSRKGNCLDNAMMENFFGIMKSELLYAGMFESIDKFKQELVKYIDYYNNERIKLRLKGMSPAQYRTHANIE